MKKLLFAFVGLLVFSCQVENIDYLKPIMITEAPSSVQSTSAILGGKMLGEGGKPVSEYGIVWSENYPPTVMDTKIKEGERIGTFFNRYEGLKPNTTYYYSAYGINEVGIGYGGVYEFTTSAEAPCSPTTDNFIDLGPFTRNIDFIKLNESIGFNDGNIEFEMLTDSTMRIFLNFNEIGAVLPFEGEYITVRDFDNQSIRSNGEIKLSIIDFGLGNPFGGATGEAGEKIYIETNEENQISFIFCDVYVSSNYTINGKITYNPN